MTSFMSIFLCKGLLNHFYRLAFVIGFILLMMGSLHHVRAQNMNSVLPCNEPNILLILDHSGSMEENNKWGQAIEALDLLTFGFADSLRFGLMYFPSQSSCGVNINTGLLNPILPNNGDAIRGSLRGLRGPDGRTPLESSILTGVQYFDQLNDQNRKNIIVLITDGLDTCARNERQDPINAAANANNRGYPVFVIGFGTTNEEANNLRGIAQAGGTNDFTLANNADELFTALENIAIEIQGEECDGQDNDCDGMIDEEIMPQRCDTQCGLGEILCINGQLSECTGGEIPLEVCDGQDNDCDSQTDEIESQPCVTELNLPGTQACLGSGIVSDCLPNDPSQEEVCDGQDNDRDGLIDEETTRTCMNECHYGQEVCINGNLLACSAAPVEIQESCNGLDEDCDQIIDEDAICPERQICGPQGECLLPCQNSECPLSFTCEPDDYCHPFPCAPACEEGMRCIAQQCIADCVVDEECSQWNEVCDIDRRICGAPNLVTDPDTNPPMAGNLFTENDIPEENTNTAGISMVQLAEETPDPEKGSSCEQSSISDVFSTYAFILYLCLGFIVHRRYRFA
jgi:hypothetical protein